MNVTIPVKNIILLAMIVISVRMYFCTNNPMIDRVIAEIAIYTWTDHLHSIDSTFSLSATAHKYTRFTTGIKLNHTHPKHVYRAIRYKPIEPSRIKYDNRNDSKCPEGHLAHPALSDSNLLICTGTLRRSHTTGL